MRFWQFPLANLLRHPARSILTTAGVAVAVGSLLALVGLARGFEQAWTGTLQQRGTDVLAVGRRAIDVAAATLDQRLADDMRRVHGVAGVAPELLDLLELDTGEVSIASGWPDSSFLWSTLRLSAGARPEPGDSAGAVIGESIAATLAKRIGDHIDLGGRPFVVRGITASDDLRSARFIIVRLPALQEASGKRGKVTLFNIRLTNPSDAVAVQGTLDRLAAAFPDLRFSRSDVVAREILGFRLLRAFAWAISVIALAAAVVLVLNTLLMSVVERRTEIGVLTAVGWQPGRIVAAIMIEGFFFGAVGGAIGASAGALGLEALARMPAIYGLVAPRLTWSTMVETGTAAVLLSVAGSAYPAWSATRLDAVEALRAL
jgi:putative ABC transport system permease protein